MLGISLKEHIRNEEIFKVKQGMQSSE